MKTSRFLEVVICISIPLVIGGLSGLATTGAIDSWYAMLNKPSFNPPNYLFGPVWTMLYVLMGISLFLVWKSSQGKSRNKAIVIFMIQMTLNFAWTFLFFYFHWLGFALIEILLLWITITLMILTFYRIDKTAALLQIPYLLWVTFASILNGAIWLLNK
jgi:translocator protein